MINEIEVSNFQSLRKLKVPVGRFTVITGPTGTGKSAFIRAVKALVFNVKGTRDVTRGEKTLSVSMSGEDVGEDGQPQPWQATIHRGGKDDYQLAVGINQKTYTKLAGKVPEPVTQVLKLSDVHFAGQWDQPYLLDTTGSEVARVLGKLTGVTLLLRAAQEANRRRLAAAAELKTRQADLDALGAQIGQYATLPQELAAVEAAEAALGRMQAITLYRNQLAGLISAYEYAAATLDGLRPVPEPPPMDRLEELAARHQRLRQLLAAVDDANLILRAKQSQEWTDAADAEACQRALDEYTAQWGLCPSCGQPVRKGPHEHQERT